MNNILNEVYNLVVNSSQSLFEKIRLFNQTENSYEEWLNWELYLIFKGAGLEVAVRPKYEENEFKKFADILVSRDNESILIEVKIAHSHTQEKYIWEIAKDVKALELVNRPNCQKVLIMFLSSNWAQIMEDEAWKKWLAKADGLNLKAVPDWYSKRCNNGSDALYFKCIEN